jgi:hypothetical protein
VEPIRGWKIQAWVTGLIRRNVLSHRHTTGLCFGLNKSIAQKLSDMNDSDINEVAKEFDLPLHQFRNMIRNSG